MRYLARFAMHIVDAALVVVAVVLMAAGAVVEGIRVTARLLGSAFRHAH